MCAAPDGRDLEEPTRGLDPGRTIRGRLRPPGSKSLAIRSLLGAGLAAGRTELAGVSDADDVRAAITALGTCGVEVLELEPGRVAVEGRRPGVPGAWTPRVPVDCGESGTLARLLTAVLGLCPPAGTRIEVTARGTLRRRFSDPLLEALRAAGGTAREHSPEGSWPVTLESAPPRGPLRLVDPASSQEVSGLLLALAGAGAGGAVEVRGPVPSEPYVRMTIAVLADFGVRVAGPDAAGAAVLYRVEGAPVAPPAAVEIEPDASAAAVALAAGCLSGGEVRIGGLGEGSRQGDVAIARHLRAFGCRSEASAGVLRAGGRPLRAASLDLSGEPDLAPVLAAVAGAVALSGSTDSRATSRLSGLETLNAKESRRVDVLAGGLRAVGIPVAVGSDGGWMEIGGGPVEATGPIVLDPHGDHRMAFAFALLGLVRAGIRVRDPGCVGKSWPGFWEALGS